MPPINQEGHYTYADYCTWSDDERWELIGGVPYAMSPAPATKHQLISGELHRQLANFLKGKPAKVFAAPFDVRLNSDDKDDTVVQPDLVVVCDSSKLDEKGYRGVPDLVIEILSPSTLNHDRVVKLEIYERTGVREYWIVDPDSQSVEVYLLRNGCYDKAVYSKMDIVPVDTLGGLGIDMQDVFGE